MKLTKVERERLLMLRRIADRERNPYDTPYASVMRATTKGLEAKGLVAITGRHHASTGRLLDAGRAHITDAGRLALTQMED